MTEIFSGIKKEAETNSRTERQRQVYFFSFFSTIRALKCFFNNKTKRQKKLIV